MSPENCLDDGVHHKGLLPIGLAGRQEHPETPVCPVSPGEGEGSKGNCKLTATVLSTLKVSSSFSYFGYSTMLAVTMPIARLPTGTPPLQVSPR